MRARSLVVIGLGLAAPMLGAAPAAPAPKPPTVTDIATCNETAAAATRDPSALARPRMPDAPAGAADPRPRAPGQKTDPSGSILTHPSDPLLVGMDAERAADPAYQAAYRRCMQQRLERAR
jgi:hypothetical protein